MLLLWNMEYFLIICSIILVTQANTIPSECPDNCSCINTSLECNKYLPSFIPENIYSVTVLELPLEKTPLNFSSKGWENIEQLYLKFGSPSNRTDLQTVRKLHDSEFSKMHDLNYLKIECNCLLEIDENAFHGLHNVKELDLDNNRIDFIHNVVNALKGQETLPNVSLLSLSNITYWELKVDDLDLCKLHYAMENKPLKELDLSETGIRFSNIQPLQLLPQLLKLNISGSDRAVFSFPVNKGNLESDGEFLPNLQVLDASYPRFPISEADCEQDEIYWPFCLDQYSDMYKVLPNSIKDLSVKNMFKSDIELSGNANKTHLCIWNKFFDKNVSVCVIGRFDGIEKLDMSENSITYIEPSLMQPLKKLLYLNLARNKLGNSFTIEKYGKSFLHTLEMIECLNLTGNAIQMIPKGSFIYNKHLRILDLSYNKLKSIDFGTDDFVSLEYLDISSNDIGTVDKANCVLLKKLFQQKNGNDSSNTLHDGNTTQMHVNFRNNPFSCMCDNVCLLTFISELNDTSTTYTCVKDNRTLVIDDLIARKALYMCKEFIVVVVFSILAVVVPVLISMTIYAIVKEQKIKKLKRLKEMGKENFDRGQKKYAVFLSFSGDDEDFVMTHVYPNLNSGLKQILNTDSDCVATGGTDFRPGYAIKDEIVRCIDESAVVIFFLSETFVNKSWCRSEVHKAFLDEKPIVLMIKGKLDIKSMPKALRKHYETYTRVHWSEQHGEPIMRPDWDHLCQTIVGLFGSNN